MAFSRCHIITHSWVTHWVRMKTFAQWINHKTPDLQETGCLALCKTPGLMICCSFPAFGNWHNQGSHKHKAKPWLEVLSLTCQSLPISHTHFLKSSVCEISKGWTFLISEFTAMDVFQSIWCQNDDRRWQIVHFSHVALSLTVTSKCEHLHIETY